MAISTAIFSTTTFVPCLFTVPSVVRPPSSCVFSVSNRSIALVRVNELRARPFGVSGRDVILRNFESKRSRFSGAIYAKATSEKNLYDFTVIDGDGKDISLKKYKGKLLLIVNVASKCGLTTSNYTELSHLYDTYKEQGLEVLAFPCNQFGGQEPGTNPEIKQFACTKFKADFPIFDKVDVNGPNTAPIYKFLKASVGGFLGNLVKWNFEKFLIDRNGKVIERYPPTTSPFQIERDIKKLVCQ
ncbi:Glutathione Peroxidase [Zostera marina]|uniref:Glutathione peroxidase n=1 Tax=Zostera marina TaxID=29655 RepID=A0A0K9PGQ6_ZOSMR|nr:Glutathione Peroxidase [Zostera marina]